MGVFLEDTSIILAKNSWIVNAAVSFQSKQAKQRITDMRPGKERHLIEVLGQACIFLPYSSGSTVRLFSIRSLAVISGWW